MIDRAQLNNIGYEKTRQANSKEISSFSPLRVRLFMKNKILKNKEPTP